jgi:TonB family protein
VLAHKVLNGEIRPDTVIFDAGRGTWCRAAEAPLVRFIVTEAGRERPELAQAWPIDGDSPRAAPVKPAGQTEIFNASKEPTAWPAVRQIDPMGTQVGASVARSAPAPRTPAPAPDVDLRAVPMKPVAPMGAEHRVASPKHPSTVEVEHRSAPTKPVSPVEVESRAAPLPDVEIEWEKASIAPELQVVPSPTLLKRMSSTKRTRIFVTSLVGGVAATVALGLVLQNDVAESSVTFTNPQVSETPPPPYTFAENQQPVSPPPPAAAARTTQTQAAARTEMAPTTADFPKFEPQRASRPIELPAAPFANDAQLVSTSDIAPTSPSPLLTLPTPPRPTRETEAAPAPVTFTQPRVRNAARVQQALEREYPIGLKDLGVSGTVEMSFYIDERGVVQRFETKQSSGNPDLDKAATQVAPVFQFTPAMRGSEAVPVWFSMAITFGKVANAAPAVPTNVVAAGDTPTGPDQPVASQFDVAPQVRNANRVRQTLDREYPIGLRAAGIGGTVEIWFYVDERGGVERFQLKKSSGNPDLDSAAMEVAKVFQFNPGTRSGTPAAGWIPIGVAFAGNR